MIRCVHCLKKLDDVSRDHVFPKSWYPDNTPANVQRPTVPTCFRCNNNLGKLEKELFLRLAMCVDPQKAQASGINRKMLDSFGIGNEANLSKGELVARRQTLRRIIGESKPYNPESGIKPFPSFGFHSGYPINKQRIMPVPIELKTVALKVVKGLEFYLNNERYIEQPYKAKIYFVDEGENIEDVYLVLAKHGIRKEFGPGFSVERVEGKYKSDFMDVIYRIVVWGTLIIYGSIMISE